MCLSFKEVQVIFNRAKAHEGVWIDHLGAITSTSFLFIFHSITAQTFEPLHSSSWSHFSTPDSHTAPSLVQ
jgi:hypothetical protein